MFIKNKTKIFTLTIIILTLFSLTGCLTSSTDETQIAQIAKNIEEAIEKKYANLFMENISYNYSDSNGGTYDNHINHLPEELFLKIEEAEDLADAFSILKIEVKVTIPESNLVLTDVYASGIMKIKISLKACILWAFCATLYNENIEYDVNFIKEDEEWKIISLSEN
jgi:hypothetical protein